MGTMGLKFGDIGMTAAHLCVDMQNLFAEPGSPWHMPWSRRILPPVCALTERGAARSFLTRFIPPEDAGQAHGNWKRFYRRWEPLTRSRIDPELLEIVPALAQFCPPATIIDKKVYSPWTLTTLHASLQARNIDTLLLTGGETDMCLMGTALGAIDLGYRVILLRDALCSSDDDTHDATLEIFHKRFEMQIEIIDTETALREWLPHD